MSGASSSTACNPRRIAWKTACFRRFRMACQFLTRWSTSRKPGSTASRRSRPSTVRRWLAKNTDALKSLADIPTAAEEDERPRPGSKEVRVFRWKGDDERSRWIDVTELRPGDMIVVPARRGGVDEFGWNPDQTAPAADVAREAARP